MTLNLSLLNHSVVEMVTHNIISTESNRLKGKTSFCSKEVIQKFNKIAIS